MIVIFFGAGGGIFVCVFLLMIISGAELEFCNAISNFIENNYITISVVLGSLSLIASAISGYMTGKIKTFIANFMAITPLMIGLVYGLYETTTSYPDSGFLSIFSVIIYAVVFYVEAVITIAVSISSMENNKTWPVILFSIISLIFNLTFW